MEQAVWDMDCALMVHVSVMGCGMGNTVSIEMAVEVTLTVMGMVSVSTCRVHPHLPINVSVMLAGMAQCVTNVRLHSILTFSS